MTPNLLRGNLLSMAELSSSIPPRFDNLNSASWLFLCFLRSLIRYFIDVC